MARLSHSLLLGAACYFCFAPCLLATTHAADDVQAFVASLRERRYHDTAAEYLDSLESDARISAAVKQTLPYEYGVVLMESALSTRDPATRDRQLSQAQAKLKSFLADNTNHALALQARQQLAAVLRTRADLLLLPADKNASLSPQARSEAGKLYDEARGMYSEAAKQLRGKFDEMPKEDENRQVVGIEWLNARINAARAMFDLAMTHDPGDNRKKILSEVASQCDEIYSKFPKAGVQARFYEGRCYQELGERKKALAAYGDLIADLPEIDAEERQLKTLAMKHALECWLEAKEYAKAVEKAVPWAKSARGPELRDSHWLEVKLSTATALKELAAKADKDDPTAQKYLQAAREFASEALRSPSSELKNRGRALLAQAGPGRAPTVTTVAMADPEVKTFDDAFEKAQEAAGTITDSQSILDFLQKEPNPDKKEIEELKKTIKDSEKLSFEYLKKSVHLVDQNTDLEKLQTTYYLLGFFHYQRGEYLEASLFGEHVARKYPDAANAKACAQVAMAALDAGSRTAQQAGKDASFETGKLAEMADYVSQKWPDQPEAQTAFATLLTLYVSQGKYDEAKKMLERVKADSPGRAEAELAMGAGLWNKYLRGTQELRQKRAAASAESQPAADESKAKAELDKLRGEAQQFLEHSVEAMRKQKNGRLNLAPLWLAQIYIEASQPANAVQLLEDPKIGPMTLLKEKHDVTQREGIPAEIYKTARRAYLESSPQQLDKATAAMDGLEKLYSGSPEGEAQFKQLLITDAAELAQQVQDAVNAGDVAKLANLSSTLESYLSKILKLKNVSDSKTLGWVAQVYITLGDGLTADGKAAKAAGHYKQAATTLDTIVARAKAQPDYLPKERLPFLQQQRAKVLRGAGEYEKAIEVYAAILKERPKVLSIQIEAAETYQAMGATKPEGYIYAIKGRVETGIWGWGKLGRDTQQNPAFAESFHKARYNLALCRKLFAATIKDPKVKEKTLSDAKNDIRQTYHHDSTLGGEASKLKTEVLLRELQKELGQQVIGLQEFTQPAANPANPPAK